MQAITLGKSNRLKYYTQEKHFRDDEFRKSIQSKDDLKRKGKNGVEGRCGAMNEQVVTRDVSVGRRSEE